MSIAVRINNGFQRKKQHLKMLHMSIKLIFFSINLKIHIGDAQLYIYIQ